MKRRRFLAVVVLIAAALAVAQHVRFGVLRVDAVRKGDTLLIIPAKPGDFFTLAFTHSVEQTVVRDFFRIDEGNGLVLYATEFRSSNAGLPSVLAPGEALSRSDGTFRISGMYRAMDEVPLWVGRAYGNTLTIHDVVHDLPKLAGDTLLSIRAGRVTVVEYLLFKFKRLTAPQAHRATKG